MKFLGITATSGRHWCMERTLGMFLNQDYDGLQTLLIYNNAEVSLDLQLNDLPTNKEVILINNYKSKTTRMPYNNLGEIYMDCLDYIEKLGLKPDIVNHMDDDDIYLKNHISEGVKGYIRGGKLAYKPQKSYYRDINGTVLAENVLEPSIFVNYEHLKEYGYFQRSVDLHHKWLQPLINSDQLFVDPTGQATFIYDWNHQQPIWKTSGDPNNPENFNNYKKSSKDHGDGILTPLSLDIIEKYYL